jgi:hypothetical protein
MARRCSDDPLLSALDQGHKVRHSPYPISEPVSPVSLVGQKRRFDGGHVTSGLAR